MVAKTNSLLIAAQVVAAVVDRGVKLEDALAEADEIVPNKRAWLAEVAHGGCRHYHFFAAVLNRLIKKPLRANKRVVHFVLINACYQLKFMRAPEYAVVDESVAALAAKFAWAKPLVNATLRNFIARYEQLANELQEDESLSTPLWLFDMVRTDWNKDYKKILTANNQKPPLTLRVNTKKINRADYLKKLTAADIKAVPCKDSPRGLVLDKPVAVENILGFATGEVSVQDESSQLVADIMDCQPNELVLDRCAAPGGKTCLLLETMSQCTLVAVDSPRRIKMINENLSRLGLAGRNVMTVGTAHLQLGEDPRAKWWDKNAFDKILVDAPCSGSGIIRRHPDIKHRRCRSDIKKFAAQQLALLNESWVMLKRGGKILYTTCSILREENDAVVAEFVAKQPRAKTSAITIPAIATEFGAQRLPGVHSGDGFYYACLEKV